ncbi:MAG: hypothetical protein HYX67_05055, partial [Candidatus Melainabacteria bacterium]|nr:hypothetical protein [Candidatus Melainabacteria bacterium]
MKVPRLTPLVLLSCLAFAPALAKPATSSTANLDTPSTTPTSSTKLTSSTTTPTSSTTTQTPSTTPTSAEPPATVNGAQRKIALFDQGVEQLQNYRPDQAIISFSRALLASKSASKNFKATVFLMIGRAFQADENDLAAVQAMIIANELAPNDQPIPAY